VNKSLEDFRLPPVGYRLFEDYWMLENETERPEKPAGTVTLDTINHIDHADYAASTIE